MGWDYWDYSNSLSERIDEELSKENPDYVTLSQLFKEVEKEVHTDLKKIIPKRERGKVIVSHAGLDARNPRVFVVGIFPLGLSKQTQEGINNYIHESPFTIGTYDLESVTQEFSSYQVA